MINITFSSPGIDLMSEFTTVLIPSFLLTTLNGLRALRHLNTLKKLEF